MIDSWHHQIKELSLEIDILKTPGTKQFKYTDITLTRYGSEYEAITAVDF